MSAADWWCLAFVIALAACDCGRSHDPEPSPSDSGPCPAGLTLCEGNCVEPTHPSCGDAS